ncbi:hypothetical protein [Sphingomonas sp. GM_Shp_1]|uniref:hypothetical protein n=1 Tax=Sphingomonas sp. GM_Shp_1 TaxID=2937381 RepID=UPI00226BAE58|nr:hypothetical protein [Sphingomonas sp. GM_Shp_1]
MILQNRKARIPLRANFVTGDYQANNASFTSVMSMKEIAISGPGGVSAALSGALYIAPAGQPRIIPGFGFLREPAATNMVSMRNAAPVSTAGWTLLNSRPSGASAALVDDTDSLRFARTPDGSEYIFKALLDSGDMNGNVVEFYNPSTTTDFAIPFFSAGAGAQVASSVYAKCITGACYLTVTGGGGSTPDYFGGQWARIGRVHTATTTGGQGRLVVRAGGRVRVILAQVETDVITSPIITLGQPAGRGDDFLEVRGRNLFDRPHTIVVEAEIAAQNNIERTFMQLGNATGKVMTVARTTDHALTGTQWNSAKRPCVPRLYGPGKVRIAHRISTRGHTVAAAGLAAHAPFLEPPAQLDRLAVGARLDGSLPMSGWIRSIEILDEISDDDLEALVANDNDAFLGETRRYVSPTGDDSNDGRTPQTAWKTLAKAADGSQFWPGTHFFLERGGSWSETLRPGNRCTYRAYGNGAAPKVGTGQLFALDENSASDFRVMGLHLTGATQRGVNAYGGYGIMLVDCEVSGNGSRTDNNSIGIAIRGNTRKAESVLVSVPSGVQVQSYAITEAVLTGIVRIECTTGGTGSATRWRVRRPDGTLLAGTASGGVAFDQNGIAFTLTGTASVGDVIEIRNKPFSEIPLPTSALAEDVWIERCNVHDNIGKAAGDAIYIEGIGGIIAVIGCNIPPPEGVQADCIQIGRASALYVRRPAHAIVRNNRVAAYTGGGKGAIVVRSETCLIEGNHVRGHNFCIAVMASGIIRWNYCENADLYNYSWGIGPGEDNDVMDQQIYGNTIVGCRRGVSISGNGNSTMTLDGRVPRQQYRSRIAVNDNDIRDADAAIFVDRATSGRIQFNRASNVTTLIDRRTQALPPGETELRINYNIAA